MRALFYTRLVALFLTLQAGFLFRAEATHIRAGEITAQRITNTRYIFTLTIYANLLSPVRDDQATFDFSDGTSMIENFDSHVVLSGNTYRRIYTCDKTFSGSGTFRVSYFEQYRNENIKNVDNGANFYVETYVSITSFAAFNNPIQLTNPPIDKAAVGKLFVHNAGAYDPDGDSISYKLIVPKSAPGTTVPGYDDPDVPSKFYLDPITGDLVWNTPPQVGLYNVAFIIEEWKKGQNGTYVRVGFVTRDMQIEVVVSSNNPPVLMIPNDTCIVAGNPLLKTIRASDPDPGDRINIYSVPPTNFSFSGPQFSVASGTFNWTPQCSDVRAQPYSYVFRAEDVGNQDTLTDYETWFIYVKGPAPTGLTTMPVGNAIVLSWTLYPCPNASKIEIYRKSCDSLGYTQAVCETGTTGFSGYVKIAEVAPNMTTYLDNNGLERGIQYCYFIMARFPLPKGGESRASLVSCSGLQLNVPMLTNVSVITTSSTAGDIQLNWLDPIDLTGPFTYNIQRARGINGTTFTTIASNFSGNSYTDTGLNTLDSAYTYRIELVGGAGGFSDPSSTTYLSNTPGDRKLNLSWNSNVPWREDSVWIYRSVNGSPFTYLTSLIGNPKQYVDAQGLNNCDTACYYLRIFSSFCDPRLPAVVYENLSETNCGVPVDVNPPRAPELTVRGCEGDLTVFTDYLDWNDVADPLCNNIQHYNVYYAEYLDTEPRVIATTDFTVTDYLYINYQSTAGCFVVTAVNRQGVEGYPSNKVCLDDCVYYELPNLITPNGDSLNDRFRPFPIPRGVEVVKFKVYNRWGGLVFSIDNNVELNWTGRSSDGEKLSDGIYYFSADIKYFHRLHRNEEHTTLKGWVQVLDNTAPAPTE